MTRVLSKKDDRSQVSNRKISRIHSRDDTKDVEPNVPSNRRLQKSRFSGVSMQRRSSASERSIVFSTNTSSQVFPSSLSQLNSISNPRISLKDSLSKRNSDFIQTEISIQSENEQKKKKPFFSRRKIFLSILISFLLILLIILSIVLPLKLTNLTTTSSPNQFTTTQNLACISGGMICSKPIFYWNYYCNPSSYNYFSCCYLSPSSTQLTIEFFLQEDISHWSIDDVSATQTNGELIQNGGFESNLNGWILTIPSNATLTTYVDNQMNLSHTGLAYLYGGSKNAPAHLKQTFDVIQGQNINISFWWADGGSSVYSPGKICQANVIIT